MGIFSSINASSSGLTAQRLRMDVISNNIANADTTRTPEGGPYRRSRVVLRPRDDSYQFKSPLLPKPLESGPGKGVRVTEITKDQSPLKLKYDPSHPDAIKSGPKKGYVKMPNVDVVTEMTNMISASRAYEANIQTVNSSKSMFNSALKILSA